MRWLILSLVLSWSLFGLVAEGQADTAITITISNREFAVDPPGTLESRTLAGPLKLTWVNSDSVAHEIVGDHFTSLTTGVLEPGQSATFELPAISKFRCVIHPEMRPPLFQFRDQFPLPTESPFYRYALQLDRFTAGSTSLNVLVAYASSPAFVAAFEDNAGGPGAMLSASALPVPQDAYPALELRRPLVANETAWVVIAMDTNDNGTFDGLAVDLPARRASADLVAVKERVSAAKGEPPPAVSPGAGDGGAFAPPAGDSASPAASENDPSTLSTVTTYLSTAVLLGAIGWSVWWRRRKRM